MISWFVQVYCLVAYYMTVIKCFKDKWFKLQNMVFQMERTNKIKIHMLICLLFITLYLNPEEKYYTRHVYFQNLAFIMKLMEEILWFKLGWSSFLFIPSLVTIKDVMVSVFDLFLCAVFMLFRTLKTHSADASDKGNTRSSLMTFLSSPNNKSPAMFFIKNSSCHLPVFFHR